MATTQETNDLQKITNLLAGLTAKLTAVSTSVNNIKTSIVGKGVEVPDGTPLADYDDKIDSISTASDVDYSAIITALEGMSTTLDTINGEVIAPTEGGTEGG